MEQYKVKGMSCAACSARVEKAVSAVDGVTDCTVSLLTNSMSVEGTADAATIIRAVEKAGYKASKMKAGKQSGGATDEDDALKDTETPLMRKRLIASVVLLIPLMYVSMGHMMWNWPLPPFFEGNHVAMGLVQFLAPILGDRLGGYNSANFFDFMIPLAIVVSAVLTLLAVIGIWEKDRPEFFGVGNKQEKVKLKEYIAILKANKELQRLMVAGAGCKLAFSIATNMTVLCMLYGAMMGDYGGLYLPMMIVGYIFSVPFFLLTVKTSQKHGQKASLVRYTMLALVMYIGVLVLLLLWKQGVPAFNLSLRSINVYTVLFVLFFGIGYGAYYATADMPIPMVADCSDYETYRSGQYVPGIMGTLFSLVDKLVSSLGSTIVGAAVAMIGIQTLPDSKTPYSSGMHGVVLILFCIVPMIAWLATLWAMKGYTLTGARMKEIQAVNAVRKHAVSEGTSLEEAMEKWKTYEDVPEEFK